MKSTVLPGFQFDIMRIRKHNAHMKQRINLTLDAQLITRAKRLAHQKNTSVSSLVEKGLKAITADAGRSQRTFADQWMGKLKLEPRNQADTKREHLWRKYRLGEHADSH